MPALEGDVIGVVAPHAGYMYSGAVAAYAYKAIQHIKPDVVAVISPMHHYNSHSLLTSDHQAYATPLGEVPLALEAVEALSDSLTQSLGEGLVPVAFDDEHSLEIQLPFLQRIYPAGISLLPVMVCDTTVRVTQALGTALALLLKEKKSVLVASTDLSHFYHQKQAEKLDAEILKRMKSFIPESVLYAEEEGAGFACGRGALAAVMWAGRALDAERIEVLKYATSGDINGDYSKVVGYAAAALIKPY